jgi:small subunit ribosomal protein S6
MRVYEEMFIVRPDITDEVLDPLVDSIKGVITKGGGEVDKVEKMGVKKLAYRVAKRMEGYYVLVQFKAPTELVRELERRLRVNDEIMKFLTVRVEEQLKRNERLQAKKAARAARKPVIPVAPSLPPEASAAVPGAPVLSSPMSAAAPAAPIPAAPAPAAPVTAEEGN